MTRRTRLVVTQTYWVKNPHRPDDPGHYEIHLTGDHAEIRRLVVVTRDEALAARALTVEGGDRSVTATWTRGRRPNGTEVSVLTTLDLDDEPGCGNTKEKPGVKAPGQREGGTYE